MFDVVLAKDDQIRRFDRSIVRGQVELRRVYRNPARRETTHGVFNEPDTVCNGAEVLERATRPYKVEALEIRRDLVHVLSSELHALAEPVRVADSANIQVFERRGMLIGFDPTVASCARGGEIGGDDVAAELRHHGRKRFFTATEAKTATSLREHAVLLEDLKDEYELPLLAMKRGHLLQFAAPASVDRLTELALRAKLRGWRCETWLGMRKSEKRQPARIETICQLVHRSGLRSGPESNSSDNQRSASTYLPIACCAVVQRLVAC